jgi:hypothetical protein
MITGMRSSVRDHASERCLPLDLIDAHIANHMMVDDLYHRDAHAENDLEAQIDRAISAL